MTKMHWGNTVLLLAALLTLPLGRLGAQEAAPPASEGSAGAGEADSVAEGAPAKANDGGFVFPPEVEALLNQASDPEAYPGTERCIFTRDIRTIEILDQQHVVFELSRKQLYLVQFPYVCHGLRRNGSLIYETRSGRLCRLDQVRAFEPGETMPNPPCTLPGFMPVEKEQVVQLKDSLKAKRRSEIDAYRAEKERKKQAKRQAEVSEPGTDP